MKRHYYIVIEWQVTTGAWECDGIPAGDEGKMTRLGVSDSLVRPGTEIIDEWDYKGIRQITPFGEFSSEQEALGAFIRWRHPEVEMTAAEQERRRLALLRAELRAEREMMEQRHYAQRAPRGGEKAHRVAADTFRASGIFPDLEKFAEKYGIPKKGCGLTPEMGDLRNARGQFYTSASLVRGMPEWLQKFLPSDGI